MALYRCEGVVLRARDLAEADRLVILYTPDRGKHRAVARGARRPRSRLASGIQPFTRALYLCWRGRSLDGISQVEVIEGFAPLRTDLERLAAATYACELIDAITQESDPQPRLFALLVFTLRALAE
ncbi:MAG TPA: DNA repair protein RecO, partial [Bacillota bacterium]